MSSKQHFNKNNTPIIGELIEERVMIWDFNQGSLLYNSGFFGKTRVGTGKQDGKGALPVGETGLEETHGNWNGYTALSSPPAES